jgi:hypothetical protein
MITEKKLKTFEEQYGDIAIELPKKKKKNKKEIFKEINKIINKSLKNDN